MQCVLLPDSKEKSSDIRDVKMIERLEKTSYISDNKKRVIVSMPDMDKHL